MKTRSRQFTFENQIGWWPMAAVVMLCVGLLATTTIPVSASGITRSAAVRAGTAGTPKTSSSPSSTTVPSRLRGQNASTRATAALEAQKALQAAARAAAIAGGNNLINPANTALDVPDGMSTAGSGGLVPDSGLASTGVANPVTTWTNAQTPTQTTNNGQTTVTVVQTSSQALLNWTTFNIGKNTTLSFDQSAGGADVSKWIAFNRVLDPSGRPSQILGSMVAPGQIYVINANGIIFGGSSQVNAHALVVSSLPINTNLLNRGLLDNPDFQYLFSQPTVPQLSGGTMPAFTPDAPLTADGRNGDVIVNAGALLATPSTTPGRVKVASSSSASTTVTLASSELPAGFGVGSILLGATVTAINGKTVTLASNAGSTISSDTESSFYSIGGKIALVGPNVKNSGTISTPDGQTIMAAALQVGMKAHDSSDASLRGLDVYLGAVDANSGVVTNEGLIEAPRANVTIAGKSVNQMGVINSVTGVSANGRIDLLANYASVVTTIVGSGTYVNPTESGIVTLGEGSLMQILPDYASGESVVGMELALRSKVNIQGEVIHFAADSTLLAPNASVSLATGNWESVSTGYAFYQTGGQIYLESGVIIDVSGSKDVAASVTDNVIAVELRGTELADNPLLINSSLRGQTVYVDITQTGTNEDGSTWVGTQIANLSGYANNIKRTIGELTLAGGSVSMSAGSSVVMQSGASVDVSGGWMNYAGGVIQTTQLTSGGQFYDISEATLGRSYELTGKWGSSRFGNGTYQSGYTRGGDAGAIAITAPSMALDGSLHGNAVIGERQTKAQPKSGSLQLSFTREHLVNGRYLPYAPTPPTVTFKSGGTLTAAEAFALDADGHPIALRADRQANVDLNPALASENGFGRITIENGDGAIVVPSNTAMVMPAGGSLNFSAANIDIQGSILARGSSLNFTAYNYSPYDVFDELLGIPAVTTGRGQFTLGANAVLDVSGALADQRADTGALLTTNGGSVSIKGYSVALNAGSVVDVSGGAYVNVSGKTTYGTAGSIVIAGGQDPRIGALLGGSLILRGDLRGFAGKSGGTLSLQAPLVQIGGTTTNANVLLLGPDFFSRGGFNQFTITGMGDPLDSATPEVLVASGTTVAPVAQNWILSTSASSGQLEKLYTTLDQASRLPVNLTLAAPGLTFKGLPEVEGNLVLQEGATIRTDPKGKVTLQGNTVQVLGSVYAPGGVITVTGASDSTKVFSDKNQALATVQIGKNAVLSAKGTTLLTPNKYGYRTGTVLDGGIIAVSGNLVLEKGAMLDVSGSSDRLDVSAASVGRQSIRSSAMVTVLQESSGGSIVLKGGQELFSDATLIGTAGGSSATGGSLSVTSGRFYMAGSAEYVDDVTLQVTQSGLTLLPGQTVIGSAVTNHSGATAEAKGYFAVDSFQNGGFDSLILGGTVKFQGTIDLRARNTLKVASGGVLFSDSTVNLTAPYISIGKTQDKLLKPTDNPWAFTVNGGAYYLAPTYGTGVLNVTANLIDIGNLSLQQIGQANFYADEGDIRGGGTLNIAGDITMRAGMIYPPTATQFTVVAYDHGATKGSITIEASATGAQRQLPLSAGGTLSLYASTINQGGTLRAPYGTINLGWNGVGTAPYDPIVGTAITLPTAGQVTLRPGSVTSVSGVDPTTGQVIPYGTILNGISWIDPSGTDITATGIPSKSISISAQNVDVQKDPSGVADAAVVDIRGGGDLYAYRWVSGTGGTKDVLASLTSFAVIPGYKAGYAPIDLTVDSDGAMPYLNSTLKVGDCVYLSASSGLPAGYYTLLPARYALLPGAYLVTPKSTTVPTTASAQPDGSTVVAGYRYNSLNSERTLSPVYTAFEVASSTVVESRAQYNDTYANAFMADNAATSQTRQPKDSGQLTLNAIQSMSIRGTVQSRSTAEGRGGMVDIGSPSDILIAAPGTTAAAGVLVLDAEGLSAFGADSLLIGGTRKVTTAGTEINVTTNHLTVDNAGYALSGADIVLVSRQDLTLAENAEIVQEGALTGAADKLLLGTSTVSGSGDGALVRVSSDKSASIIRSGVSASTVPALSVGAGARLSGAGLLLDSTSRTVLDASVNLSGKAVSLNSGQISIQLADPGALQPTTGLVLSNAALAKLQASAQSLSLLSYSSIDLYGNGTVGSVATVESLALHAAQIRGFNNNGGDVIFAAKSLILDNSTGRAALASAVPATGTLIFEADTIQLGANTLKVDQFNALALRSGGGIQLKGSGGLSVSGDLNITAPVLTGDSTAKQSLVATGAVTMAQGGTVSAALASGLGANLAVQGSSIAANGTILLPSGTLTLRALTGDLTIGGRLDVGGTAKTYYNKAEYTDGGSLNLTAVQGNVVVASGGSLSVAANAAGGDAGTLTVSSVNGTFTQNGSIRGTAGSGGVGGSFILDANNLPTTAALDASLNTGGFNYSRSLRSRTGDVSIDGMAQANRYVVSADAGSINVTGTGVINASGSTGGTIGLYASNGVSLQDGSILSVAADDFNSAGKGGRVDIEIRGNNGGVLDIQVGSTIDLSVASATISSPSVGHFTGVLHLRAPQNAAGTDVAISAINGNVQGASVILAEGYKVYTPSGGAVDGIKTTAKNDATAFAANETAIAGRLLANNSALNSVFSVMAGVEVVNPSGDLTLSNDWDFSSWRFGSKNAPGVLTMRASGNLVFNGSLSDGFASSTYSAVLSALNTALSGNNQSWSYRLTSGADFTAADVHQVAALDSLGANSGSLKLGKNNSAPYSTAGANALTRNVLNGYYQVIRTGTGDIDISAGGNVQLLNQFATIYTAGARVADYTMGGTFDVPALTLSGLQGALGAIQQSTPYAAQYTMGGGNVNILAQGNIEHLTQSTSGALVADSVRELPNNWLYRRGYVDPLTGQFGKTNNNDTASTSWWVDFSNFFEGVGALGGGNVTLVAGKDISNVDAVVPTNARMPKGTPNAAALVELGGGDLVVKAGNNIDGGVYYVERGQGQLSAGNLIKTNETRSPSLTNLTFPNVIYSSETWLPTTLFVGKGSFDVEAGGDVILGPMANVFFLPQGYSNTYWDKTYFNTYASSSSVDIASLTGNVTLREAITLPLSDSGTSILATWMQNIQLFTGTANTASYFQPWLRLVETNLSSFDVLTSLLPPSLRVTAHSGDINLAGDLTLFPSATGTLDLIAGGSINGLQPNGKSYRLPTSNGTSLVAWSSGTINVSDADPNAIPGVASPYAYQTLVGTNKGKASSSTSVYTEFLSFLDAYFNESGSTQGSYSLLQTRQTLHASGLLHANDTEPLRLYAGQGSISGLTLYSPKVAEVIAGLDITDIGLYLQNVRADSTSRVIAGRDIIAYNANSPLRLAAQATGNGFDYNETEQSGDIQISGPGALLVLAGRDFNLGVGKNNADGTGLGITSIGGTRNPSLGFEGADIILGAGIGSASTLGKSQLQFADFIDRFLNPATGGELATRYLSQLATLMGVDTAQAWASFTALPAEQRNSLALEIFYRVLRDSGRDHSNPSDIAAGDYANGKLAIATLFPESVNWKGDISLTSRQIKTTNGGNITLFAPGGALNVGFDVLTNVAANQGVLTEHGGSINIFTHGSVNVGTSRIFTLRGGDIAIWSSVGDIAAGSSSKTVQTAPPTRVLVDPQSADVQLDLAGLATGGGIGVLATVIGVPPGDVDLIAPVGAVDAGDAGIRSSGNTNVAAAQVLNASNIQTGGNSNGVPASAPASFNVASLSVNNNTTTSAANSASEAAQRNQAAAGQAASPELPSIIAVEVIGYGGGNPEEDSF